MTKAEVDVNTDPPTLEEVKMAIKVMKNGKAPGSNGVTAEMLKVEDTVTPRLLTQIFSDIWETENIPDDWKMGLIVKLPNKGDLSNCNNWRGITLLSLTSKAFSKIIQERLTKVHEHQARAGKLQETENPAVNTYVL